MPDDDDSLFRKKRIGYGWSPNGVGGWLIMLLVIVAIIAITAALRH
ncbi:MAG: hypothetical protein ACREFK_15675 [Stellaceae bacterium]